MPSFDIVALTTDEAKRRLLTSLGRSQSNASGCIGVTHYSIGNQGHDPVDPFNALTPDVSMTSPIDEIIHPPLPITSILFDTGTELSPSFQIVVPAGVATGVNSSLYLWATVFNDSEVEAELNALGFSAIVPTPAGYAPLNRIIGVPRIQDLPSVAHEGDACNVALEDTDYYFNGTTWKVIHQRFLFAIANMPRTIKFESEPDEYRVTLQF